MPWFLQPAVPEFFEWLNPRLSSVRVLNVECCAVLLNKGWDPPGCRWVWPARATLAPPPPTDGAAPLCAVRLVAQPANPPINAQSWLSNMAVYYQNLTALCLKGFDVLVLPVMPQLQVLMYGHRSVVLSPDLLESVVCQPRIVSLQLSGQWSKVSKPGCIERLQGMMHLGSVRFECYFLKDFTLTEHVALPEALAGERALLSDSEGSRPKVLHLEPAHLPLSEDPLHPVA